jgi:benzoate membrane transport protein
VFATEHGGSSLRILSVSITIIILYVAVLSIPLASGQEMGLTTSQLGSWIMVVYGIPGILAIWFSYRYQLPVPFTGTIVVIFFVASLASEVAYAEIIGGFIVAGVIITALATFGLTHYLTEIIPEAIVWAILAGVVFPFIVQMFTLVGTETAIVGPALVAYLISRWFLGSNPVTILPAVVVGILAVVVTGDLGSASVGGGLVQPTFIVPSFTLHSLINIVPVIVVIVTVQANIPTTILLRSYAYDPPERKLTVISGLATTFGSFFGPMAASLSLPLASLVANPDAGEHASRHRSLYIANGLSLVIAVFAGAAAALSQVLPLSLLIALAGLAMLGVLASALQHMLEDRLVLGPIFAFVIAVSDLSLFDLDPLFWALIIGLSVSLLLEREQLSLRSAPATGHAGDG